MHQGVRGFINGAILSATVLLVAQSNAGEVLRLKAGEQRLPSKDQALQSRASDQWTGIREFVVQFQGPITAQDRQYLRNQGFKILSYIPDDALVVIGDASKLRSGLRSQDSIRAVDLFAAEWKISSKFEPLSVFNKSTRVRTHIRLAQADLLPSVEQRLRADASVTIRKAEDRVIIADIPNSQIRSVALIGGVEWIEPLATIETQMMDLGVQGKRSSERNSATGFESGTRLMNFDAAWARGFAGQGETVAMADTGLDSGSMATLHDDLKNTIEATNVTFLPFTWEDTNGHGTHVAGSIQGTGARSSGLIRGGAYQSKFIAQAIMVPFLGILDPNALQNPNNLLSPVFQKGARIHSNSWGADAKGAYDAMAAAFDDFMWNNPDLLLVFAAGNSGGDENSDGVVDEGSLGSPASAKNVLTVGASKNYMLTGGIQAKLKETKVSDKFKAEPLASSSMSENPQGLAAFSSRGPAADGRRKPDVVAPGTNIVATRSSKIDPNGGLLWGEYDKNYLFCGGTSMATPLAAGAATVARQFIRTQFGIGSPSAALVKASLMHTAFDMYPGQFGFGKGQEHAQPGPNNHQGHGRVDMDRLTQLDPMGSLMIDERSGVGLGEELSYNLSTNTGIKATLVYTDAPGAANAAKALVNDIDLEITTPDGQRLALNDKTNNNESLSVQGSGTYTITVRGVNIPNGKAGKQPFALLVTSN